MHYEWEEAKRASNLIKHGIDFGEVCSFDWDSATVQEDLRHDYGERRYRAIGLLGMCLVVVVVFTDRSGTKRLISARLASNKERAFYETTLH